MNKTNIFKIGALVLATSAITAFTVSKIDNNSISNNSRKILVIDGKTSINEHQAYETLSKTSQGEQKISMNVLINIFEKYVGKVNETNIEQKLKQAKADAGGDSAFNSNISAKGLSENDYTDLLRISQLFKRSAEKDYKPSEKELLEEYSKLQTTYDIKGVVYQQEDLSKREKYAEAGYNAIKSGKDFSSLTSNASEIGKNSYYVKNVSENQKEKLDDALVKGVVGSEKGDLKLIKSNKYGTFLIKVTKVNKIGSFNDNKNKLTEKLVEAKMKEKGYQKELLNQIIDKYNIKIKDKNIKKVFLDFID